MSADVFLLGSIAISRPLAQVFSLIFAASKKPATKPIASNEASTQHPAEVENQVELGLSLEDSNLRGLNEMKPSPVSASLQNFVNGQLREHAKASNVTYRKEKK